MYASNRGNDPLDINILDNLQPIPQLSKTICIKDSKSLQTFLKISRNSLDDNLRSTIYSMLNHNEQNHESILKLINTDINSSSKSACNSLLEKLVYPEWEKRNHIIQYCKNQVDSISIDPTVEKDYIEFTNLSIEEKNNILRVDPYAYKNIEQRYNNANNEIIELKKLYSNEETIENIITNRSSDLMNDLCKINANDIKSQFIRYSKSLSH